MSVNILFYLMFFVSVFSYSMGMTDTHILPKWLYTLFILAIMGICGAFGILTSHRKSITERFLFAFIIALCICQAVYAIVQSIGWLSSRFSFQAVGSFDNPAGLAACLCMGVPCCLYFLRTGTKKRMKCLAGGSLFFIITGLFLSGSRAGLLAVMIVGGCWIWRIWKCHHARYLMVILGTGILTGMYFAKKDSADGRLLMLQCSWEMIKEHPITGHGTNGVAAHYMDYQAKWLSEHPDSRFGMLADNVKHVFNEYVAIGIRYGLLGLSVLVGIISLLVYSYRKSPSEEGRCALLSMVGIGVLACFSYPLTYPFVWLVLGLDTYVLLRGACTFSVFRKKTARCVLTGMVMIVSCCLLVKVVYRIDAELKWGKAIQASLTEKKERNFSDYKNLMPVLGNEPYFLYNYAAELYIAQHYEEALKQAESCRIHWADYDLEMLLGDISHKLGKHEEAEMHYLLATQMCPVRFIPLYRLYSLYKEIGETKKANKLGRIILDKPVKVNSVVIQSIKRQTKKDLERK